MVQQLEIGCGTLFLNTNPSDYPYVTKKTRLGYLWHQCYRFSITVSLKQVWNISRPEGHSETIMNHIVKLFPLTHKKRIPLLRRINACQLYLRVLWVSDLLLDPNETVMYTDIINRRKINTRSSLQYPHLGRPTQSDFKLWKDCVYKCFCTICPASIDTDRVVVWSIFGPTQLPNHNFAEHSDYVDIVMAIPKYPTLLDKFKYLPLRFQDIVGDIQIPPDDGYSLLCSLKNGNVVFASDGSYYEDLNKGTHAYIYIYIYIYTYWCPRIQTRDR
jgi:hypothetical protein